MPTASNLPPQCERTEKEMCGCIIASEGAVLDEYPLTEEHFVTFVAHIIFRACVRLRASNRTISSSSIYSEIGTAHVESLGAAFWTHCEFVPPSYAPTAYAILCDKASLRRAQSLGQWLISESSETRDIGQFCATASRRASELEIVAQSDNALPGAVKQANEKLDRMERGDKPARRLMPIDAWNKVFGGVADERYYAIASRPGLGKTAMMEQMLTSYLMMDETVVIFEKDMSPQMLVERIACREAGVPFWKYERESLIPAECRNVRRMVNAFDPDKLRIFNPSGLTAEKMCAIARREIRQRKARAIFLDHIQCLRFPGKDLREGLTTSSITIRNNVTETGVSHIVLAHINRDGAKGRPQPENIKEFDQLFGDVDALALLWSDVEAQDAKEDRPMKLYAAKNRGGAVVEESLSFNGPLLKFS